MNLLKGPFVLKILALVCALLTYFQIHQEMKVSEKKVSDPSYKLIKLTTRTLPIRVRLATAPKAGFKIIDSKVTANPKDVFVVGPEALLEATSSADTALIDVSEATKTMVKKIPLESIAGVPLSGDPYLVEVTVPIESTEPPAAAQK